MSKFAVVSGDTVQFDGQFGGGAVSFVPATPAPSTTISGSGKKLTSGARVCVKGDEGNVSLTVSYSTKAFPNAGSGTLTITALASDQTAQKLSVGSTNVILVGSQFKAILTPSTPPTNSAGASDTTPSYPGTGTFVTSDAKLTSA
jgi:hypothetical protein